MDNTSFWQSVLVTLLGMLQAMVNLVIWEKHNPQGDGGSNSSSSNQNSQDSQ